MNKEFFKGITRALIYYAIGGALALLAYLSFLDTYTLNKGSRLHHLILVITWLGGCLWMLYGLYKFMRDQRKRYYMGVVLINLLVSIAVIIWVYLQPSPTEESSLYIPIKQAELTTAAPMPFAEAAGLV